METRAVVERAVSDLLWRMAEDDAEGCDIGVSVAQQTWQDGGSLTDILRAVQVAVEQSQLERTSRPLAPRGPDRLPKLNEPSDLPDTRSRARAGWSDRDEPRDGSGRIGRMKPLQYSDGSGMVLSSHPLRGLGVSQPDMTSPDRSFSAGPAETYASARPLGGAGLDADPAGEAVANFVADSGGITLEGVEAFDRKLAVDNPGNRKAILGRLREHLVRAQQGADTPGPTQQFAYDPVHDGHEAMRLYRAYQSAHLEERFPDMGFVLRQVGREDLINRLAGTPVRNFKQECDARLSGKVADAELTRRAHARLHANPHLNFTAAFEIEWRNAEPELKVAYVL